MSEVKVPESGRLTVAQAADYAGYNRTQMYDYIKDGTLPAYSNECRGRSGRLFVFKEDIDAMLRAQPVAIGL